MEKATDVNPLLPRFLNMLRKDRCLYYASQKYSIVFNYRNFCSLTCVILEKNA